MLHRFSIGKLSTTCSTLLPGFVMTDGSIVQNIHVITEQVAFGRLDICKGTSRNLSRAEEKKSCPLSSATILQSRLCTSGLVSLQQLEATAIHCFEFAYPKVLSVLAQLAFVRSMFSAKLGLSGF